MQTELLQELGAIMVKAPELRLGQIIVNALPSRFENDAFYITDVELLDCLRTFNRKLG